MNKHPPLKNQLYYILSSSELLILYITLFYTVYKRNLYSLILVIIIIFKTVLLHPIKKYFSNYKIGLRPKGSYNCNMMNCGGEPLMTAGFPSGHMCILGILSFIVYNLYKKNKNKNIIYIYLILVLSTLMGRIFTKCHTLVQSLGGFIIGILMGIILYYLDNYVKYNLPFDIYKKHEKEFYKDLNLIFN